MLVLIVLSCVSRSIRSLRSIKCHERLLISYIIHYMVATIHVSCCIHSVVCKSKDIRNIKTSRARHQIKIHSVCLSLSLFSCVCFSCSKCGEKGFSNQYRGHQLHQAMGLCPLKLCQCRTRAGDQFGTGEALCNHLSRSGQVDIAIND